LPDDADLIRQAHFTCPALFTQEVKSGLPCTPSEAVVLPIDLCAPFEQLQKAAQVAEEAFGGLDYVVQCVGMPKKLAIASK